MNLIKRKNTGPTNGGELARPSSMLEFRNEIDELFNRFFQEPWSFGGRLGSLGLLAPEGEGILHPAIDVSETDGNILVRADIPGVEPEKIDVSVTENAVTISGEKEETLETQDENVFRAERRFGSFQRTVSLPSPVDPDAVDAKFKNGVLRVELKKTQPSHSRRIRVKAG